MSLFVLSLVEISSCAPFAVQTYKLVRPTKVILKKKIENPNRNSAQQVRVLPVSADCTAATVVREAVVELIGTYVPEDAPLMGAGLDSLGTTELISALNNKLNIDIEPTALFDHPTIGSLIKYVSAETESTEFVSETSSVPVSLPAAGDSQAWQLTLAASASHIPTGCDLEGMSRAGCVTPQHVPLARWDVDSIDTRRFNANASQRVRYGSFLQSNFAQFDNATFRIAPAEAIALEPQQRLLLEVGYEAFHR